MGVVVIVGLVLVGLLGLSVAFRKPPAGGSGAEAQWAAAVASEKSQVGRILLNVARPMANVPQVRDLVASPMYKQMQTRLLASGGVYGGSVEVFVSVTALHLFTAALVMTGLLFGGFRGGALLAGALLSLAWVAMPVDKVVRAARKRGEQVAQALPEFAELLQMPLAAGVGIRPALQFTAERKTGIVADEVRNLLTLLNTRAVPEVQAYLMAGDRLGTPEAVDFFTALMQADLEGSKVAKSLASQAEALRKAAHQKQREKIRKLPVKLVFIIAAHFMPMLFVLVMIPTILALLKM